MNVKFGTLVIRVSYFSKQFVLIYYCKIILSEVGSKRMDDMTAPKALTETQVENVKYQHFQFIYLLWIICF